VKRVATGKVRLGVALTTGSSADDVLGAAHGLGATTAHRLAGLRYVSLDVPAQAVDHVAAALRKRKDVDHVELVPVRTADAVPDDPYYSSEQPYLDAVHAADAWAVTHGSVTTKVAVIDTGVQENHPDLVGKVVGVHNSMATAFSPNDVGDETGHGTHVAGIVGAATGNALGVSSAGYDTGVLVVKAGDDSGFTDDDLAAGIQWAVTNGARVINMSLGGPGTSTALSNAVSYAQSQGVLVVASAGNEQSSTPSYPAALPNVVAVGATDAIGHRASFSNYGSWVTLAAPGTGIWSTVPTGGSVDFPSPTSGYAPASGTSMASPIVAAEAGLLFGLEPFATAAQVRSAIVGSASGYSGLGLGAGQVDFAAALDRLPPSTVPSLTSPTAAAIVGGLVPLEATTSGTAPGGTVRFLVDGTAVGSPVAPSTGSAATSWESWGVADGSHSLTVQDCNSFGCGQASTPVVVTVQNVAPAITAPADAATVADQVDVTATVSDSAPKVRLSVDGTPVGSPVSVVSGTAHLPWPTAGYSNGTHAVTVASCASSGSCGVSSGVTVTVANQAPVLTAPAVGQVVSGPFTLAATATSGAVRFLVDGVQVGFDTTAPYSAPVNFSSFADGTHTVTLQPCNAAKTLCSGPTSARGITVKSLHPVLASAIPSVFSPNGDKRADTSTLTYSLPDTETVSWFVKNGAGTLVKGPVRLGAQLKGSHTFVWNGYSNAGTRVPDGTYTAYVSTYHVSGSTTLYGQATRTARVDTVAPTLGVTGALTTIYPVTDGYRDTLAPKVTTNEAGLLTMQVKNSAGSVVRTISLSHSGTGTFTLTWNGRTTSGAIVPAGTYTYVVVSQDKALNRRGSARYSVAVSLKKLVATTVAKVVTPAAAKYKTYIGSCSAIYASSTWSGGYEYLSDYYGCAPYDYSDSSDVAATEEIFTLPAAIKYAGISVSATGQEDLPGYGDVASAFYLAPNGDAYGSGVLLGPSYGTRSLGSAPTSILYGGRTLHWVAGTIEGCYYDVRSFTVRYTYYLLK
jgi:subtilisin family serine protease/flagellar hook assembly protein FlgD